MPFRSKAANIDSNQHKGLVIQNSNGLGGLLIPTGHSLTGSIPLDVAIVDGSGTQITSFGGGTQYAELTTTSPGTGTLSLGRYQSSSPTLTNGQMYGVQLDSSGNLKVNVASGGGSGGTSSTFGAAFPATGTAVGAIDSSGNMAGLNLDASGNLKISGSISVGGTVDEASFTAGTSTFTPTGGVFNDSAAALTSGQQGTQRFTANRAAHINIRNASGTELGTASNPLQVSLANTAANPTAVKVDGSAVTQPVSNAGTFAVQAAQAGTWNITNISGTISLPTEASTETTLAKLPLGQGSTTSGQSGPLVQGAVTTAAPTYTTAQTNPLSLTTGGLLRVDASGTTVPVSLSSTTITGTVSVTQGTSPWVVSESTLDGAISTSGATLPGNYLAVAMSDGANLRPLRASLGDASATNTSVGVNPMVFNGSTYDRPRGANAASATTGTGLMGAGNMVFDGTNWQKMPGTSTAVTVGQGTASNLNTTATQGTAAAVTAGWPVINGETTDTTGTFTNATQTTSVTTGTIDGYETALVSINGTYGTATAVFEASDDGGTTWYSVSGARMDTGVIETSYTSLTNTSRTWSFTVPGFDEFRVRSTAVASGTVNVRISVSSAPTTAAASVQIGSALPTGANVIGAVTQSGTWSNTVTQATAASLNATVLGTGTFQVQTSADVPGTGTTNLGKAEDAAAASGDTGVFVLGVRNDTLAASVNTNGDYTQVSTDQAGVVITAGAPRSLKINPTDTTITSSTAETTVLAAIAATFLDVYGATFTNSSASATQITLRDATAGTVRWVGYVPAGDMRGFMLPLDSAIPQAAVNNNWTITCGTSVASLDVTLFAVKRV